MIDKLVEMLTKLVESLLKYLGIKIVSKVKRVKELYDVGSDVDDAYKAVEDNNVDEINRIFNK